MAELIVVGSGTGIPSLRRASPCLALVSNKATILVDSGPGSLRKMLEAGITYLDMDLLLYTHIHPDHVADLVPLLFACKYADRPRKKDLKCIGGTGFLHYYEQLKKLYGPWIEAQTYCLSVEELSDKPFLFRNTVITCKPMVHTPESIAYRIEFEDGKTVVVSGDTDDNPRLVELASRTDLLVLECSFPDGKKVDGHLTPSLAGEIATKSYCRRLLLTHLYPLCDPFDIKEQCQRTFQGELILAADLMRIVI
jgi:ribonuclease BN (tRNA processing enzyme)